MMPPPKARRYDPELNAAITAFKSGNFPRAVALYQSVLRRRPRLAEAHYALAIIASRQAAPRKAIECARKAVELEPTNAVYHYTLGAVLHERGDLTEALESYTKAVALDPSLADCHTDIALLLERLSRFDEASKAVAAALKANPNHERAKVIEAHTALRSSEPDESRLDEFLETLTSIAAGTRQPLTLALAWSTIADIHDRRHDAGAAFEAFARTNEADRRLQRMPTDRDRESYLQYIDALAASFSREKADLWSAQQPDDGLPSPALLVGFPRSGTTLTERALGAHPRIRSIEEQSTFESTRDEMARILGPNATSRPFHEALDALQPDHVAHLRAFYWARAAKELAVKQPPTETIVLDKLPIRIVDLPFVNRLFPDAKVLVALRDPRDVCLSCYRQRFTVNVPMSFFIDLHDTARLYEHAMRSWLDTRDAYSLPHLEIRYEDTVTEFEPRIRAILHFLDLEWNEAVLSFHRRAPERVSRTPSYHTVRNAVNTKAIARWRRYRDQLAPILPTLEPFVEAFGYEPSPPAA